MEFSGKMKTKFKKLNLEMNRCASSLMILTNQKIQKNKYDIEMIN